MSNDPESLQRPYMPTADDERRRQKQCDLYQVATNTHDDIATKWFEEHVHEEVIAVWGPPDIGSANALADGCSQLAVLYTEVPAIRPGKARGDLLVDTYMGDYWAGQQWTQFCCLCVGEWLRCIEWDEDSSGLSFRQVRPDNVYILAHDKQRTKPLILAELRLRQDPDSAEWYYAWDVHDIRPGKEAYRVVRGSIDEFGQPAKGSSATVEKLKAGRDYPARDVDGKAVIPYPIYRWMKTGELWNHQLMRGSYAATLTGALYWTGVRRAAVHAAGPHTLSVGLKPPPRVIKNIGTEDAAISMPILPGSHVYHSQDAGYSGTPMVWTISPGDHLAELRKLATESDVRALMRFGVDGSDISRQSAAPESGLALFLHAKAKRQFQLRVQPSFRETDEEAIRIASAVLRVQGIETPEDGYSLAYYELPESPQEQKARAERQDREKKHGLISDVDLYIDAHPGTSRAAAMRAIIKTRVEQAQLEEDLAQALQQAGLREPPVPPSRETSPDNQTEE